MKTLRMLLFTLLVWAPLAGVALAGNEEVVGGWDCQAVVDMTYAFTMTLQEEGEALSGTVEAGQVSAPLESPKYESKMLTFGVNHPDYGTINFSAEVNDDELKGTLGNDSFEGTLSCKRSN